MITEFVLSFLVNFDNTDLILAGAPAFLYFDKKNSQLVFMSIIQLPQVFINPAKLYVFFQFRSLYQSHLDSLRYTNLVAKYSRTFHFCVGR